jgi:hypothetical protein
MSKALTGRGAHEREAPKHRSIACVELITTAALALSTAVAVTAVSIGIARADVIGAAGHGDGTPLAIALVVGLFVSAIGGIIAADPRPD